MIKTNLPSKLDRRHFLQQALLSGTAVSGLGFSLPTWADEKIRHAYKKATFADTLPQSMRTSGAGFSNYGKPSAYEKKVIRWISANPASPGNGVSWTPLHELQGTITPNGLHYERHHNGVPEINPAKHILLIDGLVKQPLRFFVEDLLRYPMVSRIHFIECGGNSSSGWRVKPIQVRVGHAHGLISNCEWTGIPLKLLLEEVGYQSNAKWVIAESADGAALNISIPIEKLLDDGFLALYQNGERLRAENGYPMRLILPGWEGITHIKWLRQLRLTKTPIMSRNETARYTELQPSGKAHQFSFVMNAKSVITSPSQGMILADKPGVYQISGLAWSGRGKIARVEVSTDGGENWSNAHLQTPVLDKAFTRFTLPWHWQGQSAILQSRATDNSGYTQPTRATLLAKHGRHGTFHYNAIISWQVTKKGNISHVYA